MESVQTSTIMDEILDFLMSAPTLQQIIDFQVSETTQLRVRYLLDQNRNGHLTAEENAELDEISKFNHLLILLKARVHKKLL
ncbi:MAG: hypothetical protein H7175_10775 [Burkholderiales bacterium]|nr:hypothetical protein [Anaerolineae bacterium]